VEEWMKSDAVSHVEYREMFGIDFLYLIFDLCSNGLTWLIKIHDVVQTLSRALRRLKTSVMGNRNVRHRNHNISPQDLILSHFQSHENVNNYWLVTSENNFNIILLGTPQSPKQSSDKSLLSKF